MCGSLQIFFFFCYFICFIISLPNPSAITFSFFNWNNFGFRNKQRLKNICLLSHTSGPETRQELQRQPKSLMISASTCAPSMVPRSHPPLAFGYKLVIAVLYIRFSLTFKGRNGSFPNISPYKAFPRSPETSTDFSLTRVTIHDMPKQITCKKNKITISELDNNIHPHIHCKYREGKCKQIKVSEARKK